jgi:hypothetical protein
VDKAAQASSVACMKKQQLLDQIRQLSLSTAALQKEELVAVLEGIPFETGLQMENAREMRKLLMDRLRHHIAEHGC